MSAHNHDEDLMKKYNQPSQIQIKAIKALGDVDDEMDENFELMQVYLMAKAMKYSQWKEWLKKSKYEIKSL